MVNGFSLGIQTHARDVVRIHPVGNLPLTQGLALMVNGRDITATDP